MQKRAGSLLISALLVTSFMWIVTTKEAHAYIDPGTGSFLIQILLATLFGSLFALKVIRQRVAEVMTTFLSKIKGLRGNHKAER